MTENKIFQLIDLVEDIKKVDAMIALHEQDESSTSMLSQYQAKKIKLTGYLIGELNSPALKSAGSFLLIKRLLDKFYSNISNLSYSNEKEADDWKRLEAVL